VLIVETITPFQQGFNISDTLRCGNNKIIKNKVCKIRLEDFYE